MKNSCKLFLMAIALILPKPGFADTTLHLSGDITSECSYLPGKGQICIYKIPKVVKLSTWLLPDIYYRVFALNLIVKDVRYNTVFHHERKYTIPGASDHSGSYNLGKVKQAPFLVELREISDEGQTLSSERVFVHP